jgi:hypothetical protein
VRPPQSASVPLYPAHQVALLTLLSASVLMSPRRVAMSAPKSAPKRRSTSACPGECSRDFALESLRIDRGQRGSRPALDGRISPGRPRAARTLTPGRSSRKSRGMGKTRYSLEGGFFRPCTRCGRRTFWLCEDCGRPTCPRCATVERVRVGTSDRLHRMCPRCRFEYRSQTSSVPALACGQSSGGGSKPKTRHRPAQSSTATF